MEGTYFDDLSFEWDATIFDQAQEVLLAKGCVEEAVIGMGG